MSGATCTPDVPAHGFPTLYTPRLCEVGTDSELKMEITEIPTDKNDLSNPTWPAIDFTHLWITKPHVLAKTTRKEADLENEKFKNNEI